MGTPLLLILNPCAGQKKANTLLTDILLAFVQAGYDPMVRLTMARGDATRIAAEQAASAELVVCIGGDGTLNETVSGLMQAGIERPVGYIPAGSTNDFAASVGLPKRILNAAKAVAHGQIKPLDLGRFNDRYFSYVASFGAFTKTSYSTPQNVKNTWGHLAYILSGMKDLPTLTATRMVIETPDTRLEDEFLFGAVSNATRIGGVLTLDKRRVRLDDGAFELLLIRKPAHIGALSRTALALRNQQYDDENIVLLSAPTFAFTAAEPTDWTVDGEYAGLLETAAITNLPGALKLVC